MMKPDECPVSGVNSQGFIETQYGSNFKYDDFSEVKSEQIIPFVSSQANLNHTKGKTYSQASTSKASEFMFVNRERFERLKANIENIKHGQVALMKEFMKLRNSQLNVKRLNVEDQKFVLPFNETEAFMKFDNLLPTDEESKRQLKFIFMKESYIDFKQFVRRNLKTIFTVELGMNFTYHGHHNKLAASKFNIIKILKDCALETFPEATETHFGQYANQYFYYIKDKDTKSLKKNQSPTTTLLNSSFEFVSCDTNKIPNC